MTHKDTITLETERLILRPLRESDFDEIHAYMSDAETKKYMHFEPNTSQMTRDFIKKAIVSDKIYEFVVVTKDGERLAGNVGLYVGAKSGEGLCGDEAEIGWVFGADGRGKGYATEAARAVIEFAFETLKLRRIAAYCDAENAASARVMEKTQMRREGNFKKSRRGNSVLNREYRDAFGYAILAEDYSAAKGGLTT